MDEKRKAASTNVYQGETEAVEGTGKVNISDVELHLNDRKGIRKEDKKRHICKELGRSGSFFFLLLFWSWVLQRSGLAIQEKGKQNEMLVIFKLIRKNTCLYNVQFITATRDH